MGSARETHRLWRRVAPASPSHYRVKSMAMIVLIDAIAGTVAWGLMSVVYSMLGVSISLASLPVFIAVVTRRGILQTAMITAMIANIALGYAPQAVVVIPPISVIVVRRMSRLRTYNDIYAKLLVATLALSLSAMFAPALFLIRDLYDIIPASGIIYFHAALCSKSVSYTEETLTRRK